MKAKYTTPDIHIIAFENEDVITASIYSEMSSEISQLPDVPAPPEATPE